MQKPFEIGDVVTVVSPPSGQNGIPTDLVGKTFTIREMDNDCDEADPLWIVLFTEYVPWVIDHTMLAVPTVKETI